MPDILSRLRIRIPDIDDNIADELIKTATDRILLRVGLRGEISKELESICVEVVTAMYNRHLMNHEGVDTERVDVFSVKFVDDLLAKYEKEFEEYKKMSDEKRGKLRFI